MRKNNPFRLFLRILRKTRLVPIGGDSNQELAAYMQDWMLLEEEEGVLALCPAVGRWTGHYPANYNGEMGGEESEEPLENA